jgi:hypothetical protein
MTITNLNQSTVVAVWGELASYLNFATDNEKVAYF